MELKPCPFCGSNCVNDTSEPENSGEDKPEYSWVCPDCICIGPIARTVEGATDGWNTRNNVDPINKDQAIKDSLEQHNDNLRMDDE